VRRLQVGQLGGQLTPVQLVLEVLLNLDDLGGKVGAQRGTVKTRSSHDRRA
jgi:hypothetical protein